MDIHKSDDNNNKKRKRTTYVALGDPFSDPKVLSKQEARLADGMNVRRSGGVECKM